MRKKNRVCSQYGVPVCITRALTNGSMLTHTRTQKKHSQRIQWWAEASNSRRAKQRIETISEPNGVMTIITKKNRMNNPSKGYLMERNIFNYLPSFIRNVLHSSFDGIPINLFGDCFFSVNLFMAFVVVNSNRFILSGFFLLRSSCVPNKLSRRLSWMLWEMYWVTGIRMPTFFSS